MCGAEGERPLTSGPALSVRARALRPVLGWAREEWEKRPAHGVNRASAGPRGKKERMEGLGWCRGLGCRLGRDGKGERGRWSGPNRENGRNRLGRKGFQAGPLG